MSEEENIIDIEENYDWQATKAIFIDDVVREEGGKVTLNIRINLQQIIAFRILEPEVVAVAGQKEGESFTWINPRFQYLILSKIDDAPEIELTFFYMDNDPECYPTSCEIMITKFPKLWPFLEKERWSKWLKEKVDGILVEELFSFNVCDFVAHQAMSYFETIDSNSKHGYSAILLKEESFGYYDTPWKEDDDMIKLINDIRISKEIPHSVGISNIYARHAMLKTWKKYTSFTCPICLCEEICDKAAELPCNHFYCQDCIEMYISSTLEGIRSCRRNPFVCPVPECKTDMNILGVSSKETKSCSHLLQEDQRNRILLWKKDLEFPPTYVLSLCPRNSCRAEGMRKINNDPTNTIVKCEKCEACFCELCLDRIYKKDLGYDHQLKCNEAGALNLVKRYLRAKEEVKAKCDERWHWLKSYAENRETDMSLSIWVKQNANICPNCKNAIERSEGCFHMNCTECGTHFCYECGEEIFYPYYGTHHCWERPLEEMQFALFG